MLTINLKETIEKAKPFKSVEQVNKLTVELHRQCMGYLSKELKGETDLEIIRSMFLKTNNIWNLVIKQTKTEEFFVKDGILNWLKKQEEFKLLFDE